MDTLLTHSLEKLSHFRCGKCSGWWSIGDWQVRAKGSKTLYCPWCGVKQEVAHSDIAEDGRLDDLL